MKYDPMTVLAHCKKLNQNPMIAMLGSGITLCSWLCHENPENGEAEFFADFCPDVALDEAKKGHGFTVANSTRQIDNLNFVVMAFEALPEFAKRIIDLEAEVAKLKGKI